MTQKYKDKYEVLSDVFGHSSFRKGQGEIIDELLSGCDVLAVMPTGGGKSICYQLSALMTEGITLVVSPLISLMKDQVMSLAQSGVRAAYINSSLTFAQYNKVLANMRMGVYKIIYLAPERLQSEDFISCCSELDIGLVAVDEAHCVSGWGQDFRPAYLGISGFIKSLPKRPTVGAFTATATERVKDDIKNLLELQSPFEITTGFDRPNLYFEVIPTKKNTKSGELLRLMRERYADKCGIVYCGTRSAVDDVASLLRLNGYSAGRYHAGMEDEARHAAQDDFIYERIKIMVATNAFGMGIDKSNVSFVIHYNMPKDVESYYQEAGRAGRDGSAADCILLWSESDVILNRFLIEKTDGAEAELAAKLSPEERENLRRLEYLRLDKMSDYCKTLGCLRAYLLRYFGEKTDFDNCGNCSNCTGDKAVVDVTVDSQKILSCIARTGGRFGASTIAEVLRGSMNEQIEKYDLDQLSTYGIMKGVNAKYIRHIIDQLRIQGYLEIDEKSAYRIPTLTFKSRYVLSGSDHVFIREADGEKKNVKREKPKSPAESREKAIDYLRQSTLADTNAQPLLGYSKTIPDSSHKGGLLEQLRAERLRISREAAVPAYVVFSDATLLDMCRIMPTNREEFLSVSGVGKTKADKYGDAFMNIIREFKK